MLLKKIKFILKEYFGLWRLANYLHYRKVKDIRALPIEKRVDGRIISIANIEL